MRNVQSHRRSKLRFSGGVNVIFGTSQSGKTALFRAIKWLLMQRPRGLSLKSDLSEDPMSVRLENSYNSNVTCTKSKTDSKYIVRLADKEEEFRKFSKSVPDLVKSTLNIDFDISFQDQLDPYSIFNSPTELGRRLDGVIGTKKLDEWMSVVSKRVTSAKYRLRGFKYEISKEEEKLIKYGGLEGLKSEVEKYSRLSNKLSKLNSAIESITKYEESYLLIKRKIKRFGRYSKLYGIMDTLISDRVTLRSIYDEIGEIKAYTNMEIRMEKLKVEISDLRKKYVDLITAEKRCPFCFSKVSKNRIMDILGNTYTS